MSGSGLAAVHLAANAESTALTPPAAPQKAQPVATASAPAAATTVADLVSAYPDLCASIRSEGAAAERTRILGIEAHTMPGHEKLIAEMKADPAVTPDQAAGRLLAAVKAGNAAHLQGLQDVEKLTGKVPAAPSSAPSAPGSDSEKATTPEGWKAEYAASEKLRTEFATEADYIGFKANESKVRILRKG